MPMVRGDGPLDNPVEGIPEVLNSKLDTDSARERPEVVRGLCLPLVDVFCKKLNIL